MINNNIAVTSTSEEIVKRGRGRPPKAKTELQEERVKRGRGRPRKEVIANESEETIKRARGRPRKYPVLTKEKLPSGELKSVIKKVESGFLLKHMFEYFTKLLVLHQELSKEAGKNEAVFKRLKILDFQMAEVCKEVLSSEYTQSSLEKNPVDLVA